MSNMTHLNDKKESHRMTSIKKSPDIFKDHVTSLKESHDLSKGVIYFLLFRSILTKDILQDYFSYLFCYCSNIFSKTIKLHLLLFKHILAVFISKDLFGK